MHKKPELVKITDADGKVRYGLPRHVPMHGWTDFDLVADSEVEADEEKV